MLTQAYLERLTRVEPYFELWRDDRKFVELRAGLYATLYFMHADPSVDTNEPVREALIECWNDYWQVVGADRQQWIYSFSRGVRGNKLPSGKVPSIDVFLRDPKNFDRYQYYVHGGKNEDDASEYQFGLGAFTIYDAPEHPDDLAFLRLQAPFRYITEDRLDAFVQLAKRCARRLAVDQGHGGFGFLRTYNQENSTRRTEYKLSQIFSGVDIDVPSAQRSDFYNPVKGHLGIDSPHWLNFLSDYWVEKLGGVDAIRAQLPEDHFVVEQYEGGLFIQAGPYPEPGHKEDDLPPAYVWLNRVLRPIRAPTTAYCYGNEPGQLGVHNGGPEYFKRFDAASDELPPWPSSTGNGSGVGGATARPQLSATGSGPRCEAGQPCPREGWWFTPARLNSRRRFEKGEIMPDVGSNYGTTIWQWDESQSDSLSA